MRYKIIYTLLFIGNIFITFNSWGQDSYSSSFYAANSASQFPNLTPNEGVNNNQLKHKLAFQKAIPDWVGYGLAGLGEGIFIAGLLSDRGQEEYDIYQTFLDPNAEVYAEKSRDEFFEDSNDKFRRRQAVIWIGTGVVAAGVAILVNNLILQPRKGVGNGISFSLRPSFQSHQLVYQELNTLGIGCTMHF